MFELDLEWNFSVVMLDLKASNFRGLCSTLQAKQEAELRFQENKFFYLGTVGFFFLGLLFAYTGGFIMPPMNMAVCCLVYILVGYIYELSKLIFALDPSEDVSIVGSNL